MRLPGAAFVPEPEETTPQRTPPGLHAAAAPERRWPETVPALPLGSREHRNDRPVFADFDAPHFVVGGGVAIFHLASARVVLCWHTRDRYWFLPKGRRDAGEESGAGAEREGYEESGFRNRLLPLPLEHKQPRAAAVTVPLSSSSETGDRAMLPEPSQQARLVTEPVLTQLLPVTRHRQYLLQWYIAETIPPRVEDRVNAAVAEAAATRRLQARQVYVRPPPFPTGLTLRARIEQDTVPIEEFPTGDDASRHASLEATESSSHPPEPDTVGVAAEPAPAPAPPAHGAPSHAPLAAMEGGVRSPPIPSSTHTISVRGAHFEMSPAMSPPTSPGRRWAANTERVSAWTDRVEAAGGSPPLGALLGSPNPTIDTLLRSPDPNAPTPLVGTPLVGAPPPQSAAAAAQPGSSFHTPQSAATGSEWGAAPPPLHRPNVDPASDPASAIGSTRKQRRRRECGLGIAGASAASHSSHSSSSSSTTSPKSQKTTTALYVPPRHPDTGVDAEEALYTSELVPVEEAVRRLAGSGMERVVRIGWAAIGRRFADEEAAATRARVAAAAAAIRGGGGGDAGSSE